MQIPRAWCISDPLTVTLQNLKPEERRCRLLMVCAHEPSADPRIAWAARSASAAFDVTVLGFAEDQSSPHDVQWTGYQTVRLQRSSAGIIKYLWLMKDVVPGTASAVLSVLIVLASPFLLMAEAALWAASNAMRRLTTLLARSLPHIQAPNGRQTSGGLQIRQNSLLKRVRFSFFGHEKSICTCGRRVWILDKRHPQQTGYCPLR